MTSYIFKDIVDYLNRNSVKLETNLSNNQIIENINSIENANSNDLIFFSDLKYLESLNKTKAKGCFMISKYKENLPNNCEPIIVDNPYLAFTYLTNFFYKNISSNGKISKYSDISKISTIKKNVQINNYVSIKDNVIVNNNTIISENSVIGPNVEIEENVFIGPNSTLSNCIIKQNSYLKSNVVVGGTGFGFETNQKVTFQHFGKVLINENVHIGSNTTIDRATFGYTEIGDNSRLDNLIQIAHNVKIGKNAIIAAQVGIAGSTVIGNKVTIGGQAGISGHLNIGNNVTIAAKSGVTRNLSDNSVVAGFPAIDIKKWKINTIKFNKLK